MNKWNRLLEQFNAWNDKYALRNSIIAVIIVFGSLLIPTMIDVLKALLCG